MKEIADPNLAPVRHYTPHVKTTTLVSTISLRRGDPAATPGGLASKAKGGATQ